jgi:hypothetical protein
MDQSIERWLPVPDYEGLFEVSDHGRVRRTYHARADCPVGSYVCQDTGNYGHKRVLLCGKRWLVHRLVLLAFVGPPPPRHLAAHGDGDPSNNRLSNLRWATQSENLGDRAQHGTLRLGEKHHNATITAEIVMEMRQLRRDGGSYQAIADKFQIPYHRAHAAITGKSWSHVPSPCPTGPYSKAAPLLDDDALDQLLQNCRD